MPIFLPMLLGAGIGAGLGAAFGPKDRPLWETLLISGGLGATAGLGLGAAGLGAAAPAVAAAPGATAPVVVGTGTGTALAGSSLPSGALHSAVLSGTNAAINAGAAPAVGGLAGAGAAPAVAGAVSTTPFTIGGNLTAAQGAANLGFAGTGAGAQALGGLGAAMANHPFITAGTLGAGGMMLLPGGKSGGRKGADETYPQDASWEGGTSRDTPVFYGNSSAGGVGRSFYDPERFMRSMYYRG